MRTPDATGRSAWLTREGDPKVHRRGDLASASSRYGLWADVVVDPSALSPHADSTQHGHLTAIPAEAKLGLDTMDMLARLPVFRHRVRRVADASGVTAPKRPRIFSCVRVSGKLDSLSPPAPLSSRIVVAGVCMTQDTIRPVMAINKEIALRFVVGYTPREFGDTLRKLAEGKVKASVIGTVGLDGVETAFTALKNPEQHAKILIDPSSSALLPTDARVTA